MRLPFGNTTPTNRRVITENVWGREPVVVPASVWKSITNVPGVGEEFRAALQAAYLKGFELGGTDFATTFARRLQQDQNVFMAMKGALTSLSDQVPELQAMADNPVWTASIVTQQMGGNAPELGQIR